jgi:protein arginine N-methyltransferase 2
MESANEVSADNQNFLTSRLSFVKDEEGKDRCVDVDGGLVMAAWETDIMQKSAALLCMDQKPGFSVLNVGFGLGIIDEIFQSYKPGRHVIVEAHPDAIAYAKSKGWDQRPGVELVFKRWEDAITELGDFDVVYWDTFAQDYEGEWAPVQIETSPSQLSCRAPPILRGTTQPPVWTRCTLWFL